MIIKDLKNKRVLVTGGAGFLGSHLCKRLIALGSNVLCVDNLITGKSGNIGRLVGHPRFEFLKHNVTQDLYVSQPLFAVLHFASPAAPDDYQKYPIQTLKVGALGTHKMLGLAKAKKARFLLASTSEVYGDPLEHPQRETYWGNVNPVGLRGVYDEAKRYAEALVMAYHRIHKLETRIARIFNMYGPGMRPDDGRAIPAFIKQALAGKSIPVNGNGKQTRSFTYIEDGVEGLLRLLVSDYVNPVNLGNPHEMTVIDCAKMVIKLTNSKSRIIFKPLPIDDPKQRLPNIDLARKKLGWEPKVFLEEGLKKTIAQKILE